MNLLLYLCIPFLAGAFNIRSLHQIRYVVLNHLQKKNQRVIIRNENIPSCVNCHNFVLGNRDEQGKTTPHTCTKFNYKDVVTGDINQELAEDCRSDEKMCGKHGIYFTEK